MIIGNDLIKGIREAFGFNDSNEKESIGTYTPEGGAYEVITSNGEVKITADDGTKGVVLAITTEDILIRIKNEAGETEISLFELLSIIV